LSIPVQMAYAVKWKKQEDTIDIKDISMIRCQQTVHIRKNSLQNIFSIPTTDDNFSSYIASLPMVYKRNMGQIEKMWMARRLATYLEKGQVIGVGDASVDKKSAAHAYIIESFDEEVSIQGAGPVDNDIDDVTSNRAETCSVLAMLTLATALAAFYDLHEPKITIYSDNAEALRYRDHTFFTYSKFSKKDMDLKLEITYFLKHSPLIVTFKHVQSHADDSESFVYEDAAHETRRNIDMDKEAKRFLNNPPSHLTPNREPMQFGAQKIALKIQDSLITGDITHHITLHKYGHALEKRIQQSLHITSTQLEQIEWEGIEVAFRKLPEKDKISRMKIMHKYLPTRSLLYSRDDSTSSTCVRCENQSETFQHIFQCKCRQNRANHRKCVSKLRQNLRKALTHPLIINAIDMLLIGFHNGVQRSYARPLLGDATKIKAVQQVFNQQQHLGAESLVRGFILLRKVT